jgi:mRNA-degrading endonuclease RelE of RelBE toxin-antitoxin system
MPNEAEAITIRFADDFEANLYALAKRYRSIRNDVQPVIEQIQAGNFIGDRLTGMGEDYIILKVRVKNSNIQKGKSAGYRMIYQVESPSIVLLLTIYSKSVKRSYPEGNRTDISLNEIRSILAEFDENE